MITRIEIDGFKSFVDFSLDLHPFTAVIGTNAGGKSNLIDAFRFLSAAVKGDLYDAVEAVRGDAESLFHQFSDGTRVESMRFALEFSVSAMFAMPLRYEVSASKADPSGRRGLRTVEQLRPIDGSTLAERDAVAAQLLGREYVSSLRACQFESSALRELTSVGGRLDMGVDGSGLPGYLARLREETATEDDPRGALREIGLILHGIIPDVTGFEVIEDRVRRDIRVEFSAHNEPPFESAVASDGTLRTLAVLATLADPAQTGLLLVDEPENGIYPERLRKLLRVIKSTTDPRADDPAGSPRQVLLASHSPVVLDVVPPEHVVFLDVVSQVGQGKASRVTRARRAAETTAEDSTANWGPLKPDDVARLRSGGEMPD